ncbi:MAG: NADH-quinone oxidoreductase subunit NuoH [Phycisphaerales bacterium]|nr:NADH-quinone oxidoreductase subunit NuoH [Phycisphaerales bacterium]
MPVWMLMLAGAVSPFSMESWWFGALGISPALWMRVIYSLLLIAVVFLPLVSVIAMFSIWWERKVAGHMQSRLGPNRVGPIGILQSIADGLKLILKEDLVPRSADSWLFRLAPYLAFAPVFAAFLALPFGPEFTFEPRLSAGLFWVLAILSVEVMGVILAGWASNNKWSLFGAMREAGQMVSYEIPLGISILVGVMSAGTLNLVELGFIQGGGLHTWLVFQNPFTFLAFFCYFIASLASNKRAPFDLPESESELVAGFHTEYSGLRFSFFFFAEYAAMFIVGGIQAALFLGGWNDPFGLIGYYHQRFIADPSGIDHAGLMVLNVIAAAVFVLKALGIMFVQMWLRWTLPRPRIDQVLYVCIKVLLPMACVILLGAALWQLFVPRRPGLPWVDYSPWRFGDYGRDQALGALVTQVTLALVGVGMFAVLLGWVVYAAISGRNLKRRLTDPAPIPM